MRNFTPKMRQSDNKTSFRFRDRPNPMESGTAHAVDVVDVDVVYALGGTNYFSGRNDPRGVYIHITPRTIERSESGYFVESQWLLAGTAKSGAKMFVLPLARYSEKRLRAVAEYLDGMVSNIATTFRTNPDAAFSWLKTAIEDINALSV